VDDGGDIRVAGRTVRFFHSVSRTPYSMLMSIDTITQSIRNDTNLERTCVMRNLTIRFVVVYRVPKCERKVGIDVKRIFVPIFLQARSDIIQTARFRDHLEILWPVRSVDQFQKHASDLTLASCGCRCAYCRRSTCPFKFSTIPYAPILKKAKEHASTLATHRLRPDTFSHCIPSELGKVIVFTTHVDHNKKHPTTLLTNDNLPMKYPPAPRFAASRSPNSSPYPKSGPRQLSSPVTVIRCDSDVFVP
jgi:hypothetical protein